MKCALMWAVVTFICVWIGTDNVALAFASLFALATIYSALEETK